LEQFILNKTFITDHTTLFLPSHLPILFKHELKMQTKRILDVQFLQIGNPNPNDTKIYDDDFDD